jgi:hypothetical protein
MQAAFFSRNFCLIVKKRQKCVGKNTEIHTKMEKYCFPTHQTQNIRNELLLLLQRNYQQAFIILSLKLYHRILKGSG